jgi:hypothetical protein
MVRRPINKTSQCEEEPRPDSRQLDEGGTMSAPWRTATDRAAKARADIERLFGSTPLCEFFHHVEELIREAINEHEIDIRREYADDE